MSDDIGGGGAIAAAPDADEQARRRLAGRDAEAVSRLRRFIAQNGDGSVGVIEHLGRVGARIVMIAPDGQFGDALARSVSAARQACALAGLPVREWDRELTSLLKPMPADRVRMGGGTH